MAREDTGNRAGAALEPGAGPQPAHSQGPAYIQGVLGLVLALIPRALVSPRTARALLVVAWRFRRNRWYLRFPFLPLPARDYVRWRMYTAYGDYDAIPPVEDVIRYARWAARFP